MEGADPGGVPRFGAQIPADSPSRFMSSCLHSAVCARVLVRARRGGGVFLKGWVTSQMGGFTRGPDGAEQ